MQERVEGQRKSRPVRIPNDMIVQMVDQFYEKVRSHAELGPIFNGAIQENWPHHLQKMYRFWSSVLNSSGVYSGNPMAAHMNLQQNVVPENFGQWLTLFQETLSELFEEEDQAFIYQKAENIAQSLSLGMFYNPASTHRINL
ncbi:group III truncated hemoglobin [Sneathiella limimaris]|uniref:group III truncated hemoglobin n=1 Tax=Sneathiella limimaris TaxID=1964213 RepID=UPI00146E33F6|nr:group III truncated hemoglobin [Sneathiella limimaris]